MGRAMKRTSIIIASLLLLGFISLGVRQAVTHNHQLRIDKVELESASTKLKALQLQYEKLDSTLDTELHNRTKDEQKIKQLESEKQQLDKQKQELEAQLQAKLDKKRQDAERSSQLAASFTGTATAAAASGNWYKDFIYQHESGNNPGAINASSGACGLGQALPCSKMGCSLSDYACQDAWFTNYAMQRYGSWEAAYYFWVAHRWW